MIIQKKYSRTGLLPVWFFLLLLQLPVQAAEISINSSTPVATAGYFQLSWSSNTPTDKGFLVQESRQEDFASTKTLYEGMDSSSLISGKADGDYFYRVASISDTVSALANKQDITWSETLKVRVEHHSLQKAFGFFLAGLIVFLASLTAIIIGNRKAGE